MNERKLKPKSAHRIAHELYEDLCKHHESLRQSQLSNMIPGTQSVEEQRALSNLRNMINRWIDSLLFKRIIQ